MLLCPATRPTISSISLHPALGPSPKYRWRNTLAMPLPPVLPLYACGVLFEMVPQVIGLLDEWHLPGEGKPRRESRRAAHLRCACTHLRL